MFEYISYIFCFAILILFAIYIYIRLKFGFWYLQPVFHIYNLNYMLFPPGIIDENLPIKNKYTNFKNIETILFSSLTSMQKSRFINLIKLNYLQNKDNLFSPKSENVFSYFIGFNEKTLISFYYNEENMLDIKYGNLISDKKIIGAITSRPMEIIINCKKEKTQKHINAYYVDYLCVDLLHRKKGIAPQLIQTHHYNQRHINKNIVISLFKREDELTGIVPLCVYSTYGFSVSKWTKPYSLTKEYKILEINKTNFRFLYNFILEHSDKFDIIVKTHISNLLELINTKNIYIYVVMCDMKIICCYFLRKTCIEIEKGLEVLSLFASICDCEENIFIQGFKIIFWNLAAEKMFGYCAIENISHNDIIINNIIQKTNPTIISPTAYFFYNFAYPTFQSNKTLIIN